MMLRYWNRPEATADKFRGDWLITGDRGIWEGDYLRFVGREDDVITSAGYRIGPAEIEDCLLTHPAVATVGVIGKPDSLRTQIVKAYVVLKAGAEVSAEDLQAYVKDRLASYSYPREVANFWRKPADDGDRESYPQGTESAGCGGDWQMNSTPQTDYWAIAVSVAFGVPSQAETVEIQKFNTKAFLTTCTDLAPDVPCAIPMDVQCISQGRKMCELAKANADLEGCLTEVTDWMRDEAVAKWTLLPDDIRPDYAKPPIGRRYGK